MKAKPLLSPFLFAVVCALFSCSDSLPALAEARLMPVFEFAAANARPSMFVYLLANPTSEIALADSMRLTHRETGFVWNIENPLVIEIGFGMGAATAAIAEANPGLNYLGIEVYRSGIGSLLGNIERSGLKNIRIIEHDALEVIASMIAGGSVRGFHLFFPDPWPKTRHHKRRLVQRPHTDLLAAKLVAGGYIYFVTDWEPYAHFAREQLDATPQLANQYGGFAPKQSWRPETKFERKGKANSRDIFELVYKKG